MNSAKNESVELPKRKHPRLDNYDYSSAGLYFITICAHNRKCIFSRIVTSVENDNIKIAYKPFGKIAENQLLSLKNRYPSLKIYAYVIMPNHIHLIINPAFGTAGASPRPTVMEIICTYSIIV